MIKAWDMQDLLARLEKNGLTMAEKEAKDATVAILGWAQESLVMEGGILGAIAAPAIALVQPIVLKLEDKIDGIEGN